MIFICRINSQAGVLNAFSQLLQTLDICLVKVIHDNFIYNEIRNSKNCFGGNAALLQTIQ